MKQFIYADNAATTRLSDKALDAMLPWLKDEYANASQPYSFARKPKKAISEAREIIAQCIGADSEEIFFTSCGTESNNWVIQRALSNVEKRSIVTTPIEHHAILNACKQLERIQGTNISYLHIDGYGTASLTSLEESLIARRGLVSVMMANNEIGSIQPIIQLSDIAHRNGSLFHTDAVQAVGHIDIDVNKLGVDFLSASAHKFNGPKGVGFLYVRKGRDLSSLISGGAQEFDHRAGTENVAGIVGMAIALRENVENLSRNQEYISGIETELLRQLNNFNIPYHRNGSDNHLPGLISLSFPGQDGESILHRLDLLGICVSTGSACDSNNTQISHVLQSIKLDPALAKGTIRISLGKHNTISDVHAIAEALKRVLIC